MSLDAMRWAKIVKTGRSSAKSVLTWLADMCGADLCAFPSIKALVEATELDKKTVQASLQYLIETGFIEDTGERRGRTKQIPVYRLLGVEESISDSEHTQKREHYQKRERLKTPKNGDVKQKEPENGCLESNQRVPFFPSNDPKNGIRNPPKEPKDLNPTYNASQSLEVRPVEQLVTPEYAGQPGTASAMMPIGKFAIQDNWEPTADFRQRIQYWGIIIPEGLNLHAELHKFRDYWIAEQKVFNQVQWEQKFARQLQRAGTHTPPPRGNQHVGLGQSSTANAAVQRAHAARAAQLRARGENVEVLGANAGNLLNPVGGQKRIGSIGPMDCSDWEFDQRPDDERL